MVKKIAQALAFALLNRKCNLVTDGTDNRLLLWDLTAFGTIDRNYEKVCEACHVSLNKFSIYGSIYPGGVRIAMTSRCCLEDEFEILADFLQRAAQVTSSVQREGNTGNHIKDFLKALQNHKDIVELRNPVEKIASQFAFVMPGFDI